MKKKLIFIFIILLFTLSSCKRNRDYSKAFGTLSVNDTEAVVIRKMGKPQDSEETNYYKIFYWFDNCESQDEANEKYKQGIFVTYYCVILTTEDFTNYKIDSKEDIVTGTWGVR